LTAPSCVELAVPFKADVGLPNSVLAHQVLMDARNANHILALKNTVHTCVKLPGLDGGSGWNLDTSQCHKNPDCVAISSSFQLHPLVQSQLHMAKAAADKLTRGQTYTCLHLNSAWCDGKGQAEQVNIAPWDQCIYTALKSMLYDTAFVSSNPAILLVGQRDAAVLPLLKAVLNELGIVDKTLFTASDIGLPAPGQTASANYDWFDPAYARRGAVSWGLCSPGYANSYIGESWSGFTWTLLANGLINPQSRGLWSMMMYSYPKDYYEQLANAHMFIGPPASITNNNYYEQMLQTQEQLPYWLTPPPWVPRR